MVVVVWNGVVLFWDMVMSAQRAKYQPSCRSFSDWHNQEIVRPDDEKEVIGFKRPASQPGRVCQDDPHFIHISHHFIKYIKTTKSPALVSKTLTFISI